MSAGDLRMALLQDADQRDAEDAAQNLLPVGALGAQHASDVLAAQYQATIARMPPPRQERTHLEMLYQLCCNSDPREARTWQCIFVAMATGASCLALGVPYVTPFAWAGLVGPPVIALGIKCCQSSPAPRGGGVLPLAVDIPLAPGAP